MNISDNYLNSDIELDSAIKFSVLMCCNRDDGFLEEAINSVLKQSYKNFEFVIVLNNCTDELYRYVAEYSDPRILLARTKVGQLSFNLNYGANICTGEYIVRMDADDVCELNRLEITKEIIKTESYPDLIAGSAYLIDVDGVVVGFKKPVSSSSWMKEIYFKNPFLHPATTIKRETLLSQKGYLGGFQSEDYELWLRFLNVKNFRVYSTSEPFIRYRLSANQTKGSKLSYAEVCSHMLKFFLLYPSYRSFLGLLLSLCKFSFRPTKK